MEFIDLIKCKAKEYKKTIVLPESKDIRVLEAASKISTEDFAKIVLIGDEDHILSSKINLDKAKIINPKKIDLELYIDLFIKLRAHKGMTKDIARDLLLNDPLYFGVALLSNGDVDGMVAGSISPTANVLRASIQIIGKFQKVKVMSTFMLMIVKDTALGLRYENSGIFGFSDCGLIQDPTSEELAQIALSSATTFKQLTGGIPKVALLSHSTRGSAKHHKIDKILKALDIIKNEDPNLQVDGELQLDAALIDSIGKEKAKNSNVAGHANVLIFPDIDAGNIGYKLVHRLAKAEAYGPLIQGIAKPVNDLSRGCSVDDIMGVTAITALQSL